MLKKNDEYTITNSREQNPKKGEKNTNSLNLLVKKLLKIVIMLDQKLQNMILYNQKSKIMEQ